MNTGDKKEIRRREKEAALAERNRGEVLISIASTIPGRKFLWDQLVIANVFTSTYNDNPVRMSFLEGQRSAGLSLLNDFVHWAPEEFIQAMREANERRVTTDSTDHERTARERTGSEDGDGGNQEYPDAPIGTGILGDEAA